MRIQKARAVANLVRLLYRLGLVSSDKANSYIDHLQIMVLEYESMLQKGDSDGD